MARFATQHNRTAHATLPIGSITVDTVSTKRFVLYDIILGSEASPADNAFLHTVQKVTAAGTSTGVTPTALDDGDTVAAVTDAGENHTVDATATAGAILLAIPLNQRATYRWVAAPGGEIVCAGSAKGVAFYTPTSSAVAVTATAHFIEQ